LLLENHDAADWTGRLADLKGFLAVVENAKEDFQLALVGLYAVKDQTGDANSLDLISNPFHNFA